MKSLKRQNAPLIHAVLLVHTVVFVMFLLGPNGVIGLASVERDDMIVGAGRPTVAAFAYVCVTKLFILGLLPAFWRDRLIHWRWRYPLPGAQAFSVIGPNDCRVNMGALAEHYGPLPEEQRLQDPVFYKIYSRFKNETGVLDAHGNYLAARDVATINAFMLMGLPFMLWWFSSDLAASISYASIVALSYILSAWAAQQYGVRFVQNVLAIAASATHCNEDKVA